MRMNTAGDYLPHYLNHIWALKLFPQYDKISMTGMLSQQMQHHCYGWVLNFNTVVAPTVILITLLSNMNLCGKGQENNFDFEDWHCTEMVRAF